MKVCVILGTRPEAIKLAPVIGELRRREDTSCTVVVTGQHPVLGAEMLSYFGIEPDITLDTFQEGRSLAELTAVLTQELGTVFVEHDFDYTLVQGDTTSALVGALASFYAHIPVGHVEAGLRTSTPDLPFPEEMNRRLISRIAALHCAPTDAAVAALSREGISGDTVVLTGNTVIDAQLFMDKRYLSEPVDAGAEDYILCTLHRRENWGSGIDAVCDALDRLLAQRAELRFRFILHPNPVVADRIRSRFGRTPQITLYEPQGYLEFLRLLKGCRLVISDSGGVVEEAPTFGKHVLITRDETERNEAVELGLADLVGTDVDHIVAATLTWWDHGQVSTASANPFGDGHASARIVDAMCEQLQATR